MSLAFRKRTSIAAKIYIALIAVVVVFQCALIIGAPWGAFTMGGAFPGTLPPRMRVAAALSAALLALSGMVVAARAGIAFPSWHRATRWAIWVVVAYMCVGVVLNAITPSAGERMVWLPVTIVLAVCALVVGRSSNNAHSA